MLNFKRVSLLLLALLLALSFAACTEGNPVDEPLPGPPIEEPPHEEDMDDNEYTTPVPPIGDLDDMDDTDWSQYAVIIDGVGVSGASLQMIGEDEIFPTHVSLMALEQALNTDIFWNLQTDEVFFPGLNGNIHFFAGSADFTVDGETITLAQEALRIDDELYVPIQFFRDVYGASAAYFSGGHVFIHTEGGDMD